MKYKLIISLFIVFALIGIVVGAEIGGLSKVERGVSISSDEINALASRGFDNLTTSQTLCDLEFCYADVQRNYGELSDTIFYIKVRFDNSTSVVQSRVDEQVTNKLKGLAKIFMDEDTKASLTNPLDGGGDINLKEKTGGGGIGTLP